MSWRTSLATLALIIAVGCFGGGSNRATILNIPLHVAPVTRVSRWQTLCSKKGRCSVEYKLRVTNLSQTGANVAECHLVARDSTGNELFAMGLPIGVPAGTWVGPGATAEGGGISVLPVRPAILAKVASS